jgi:hypothetical protein
MSRFNLSQPSQPLAIRWTLRLYEFLASLKLAVVLILSLAVLLGLATFVEANYGTAAVGFLIYHTWFFTAVLALLALNIFCAASIRFPWKRHQTGFVITHIGLLTLLTGSAISDRGSVNSQMLCYLGDSSRAAIDMDQSMITVEDIPGRPEPLQVRFAPGPFNWSDLGPWPVTRRVKSRLGLDDATRPWVHPPVVLFDDGRTQVEVVDYYARSEVRRTPYLALELHQRARDIRLPIDLEFDALHSSLPFARASLGDRGELLMWKGNGPDALEAFKGCIPDRTVEGDGLVVFWWKGTTYSASVRELQKLKEQKQRFEISPELTVELEAFAAAADLDSLVKGKGLKSLSPDARRGGVGPAVQLQVYEKAAGGEKKHELVRFAELPFLPDRSRPSGFCAELYHPSMPGRIDILIGAGDRLAYRAWQKGLGRVVGSGDLEIGTPVKTWSMGGGESVMEMTARRFIPGPAATSESGTPVPQEEVVLPLPFDKADRGESKRIKLRIGWTDPQTGRRGEDLFWLKQNLPEPWESPRRRQVHETAAGAARPIRSSFSVRQTDVGFAVQLVDFDLEVDPGTKTAANYTSHIVQVDVRDEPDVKRLREQVDAARTPEERQERWEALEAEVHKRTDAHLDELRGVSSASERAALVQREDSIQSHVITMNRPLDYPDRQGRQLRFFQENYVPPDKERKAPLASVFRVNYDPGRPVKYLGSGLIVFGIFLMFYMRAYFFKRPAKGTVT